MGPFDNTDRKGYHIAYGPEKHKDFSDAKNWKGKHGPVKVLDLKGDRSTAHVEIDALHHGVDDVRILVVSDARIVNGVGSG